MTGTGRNGVKNGMIKAKVTQPGGAETVDSKKEVEMKRNA